MIQLFLVPTPIGNLEDITLRAIKVLKEADLILAEDTRTSGKLLKHFTIDTPQKSYHMHNEHELTENLVKQLKEGAVFALITDAGTPGISDPGYLLVREASKAGIEVSCLPGATAFVPALVNSALPNNHFYFEGFLPVKKGRQTRLKFLETIDSLIVLYESPYKILKTLGDLATHLGDDRRASISREISKFYEETKRGSLLELMDHFKKNSPKGEFVIIVEGRS